MHLAKSLTVKTIEAAKPSMIRTEIPDGATPGLFLIVQPTGAKSWAYRYRSPLDGRTRKLTIGKAMAFSLAEARASAREAAHMVAKGQDPGELRKLQKVQAENTSDTLAFLLDEFISRHVERNNKGSTAKEVKRLIATELRPAWGDRKIGTISKADAVQILDRLVDRGAEITANRTLALIRKFFNWAIERGLLETSPVRGMKAPTPEKSRERVLGDYELDLLWQASSASGIFGQAIRTMLLTGQRRGEVSGMCWSELDLTSSDCSWSIPAARTKNSRAHIVPLSAATVAVLLELPRIKGSPFVFTSTGEAIISGWSKAKLALDRRMHAIARERASRRGLDAEKVSIPSWRLHDLRRTAASGMARLGQPVHVVEALLNHKSGSVSGVAAVYNRYDYAAEKRRAADVWARHLDACCTFGRAGSLESI